MSGRTYIDLTHALVNGIPAYPGDPVFTCTPHMTVPKDRIAVDALALSSHSGTHIDAPSHFFEGLATVDQLPLSLLADMPVVVVDFTPRGLGSRARIEWADFEAYVERIGEMVGKYGGGAVLVRTGWSRFWTERKYVDHPYLDEAAAQELVDMGVTLLGVDTFSPDQTPGPDGEAVEDTGFGVHKVVLGKGLLIVENLNLEGLEDELDEKEIHINVVPLKIGGSDGSPVRAFAWKI